MTRRQPETSLDLIPQVLAALEIEPAWTERDGAGAGFVAGELGVWLAASPEPWPPLLHVEARVAREVADCAAAADFCNERNYRSLLGRWVVDEDNGLVALVADLPVGGAWTPEVLGECVAEIANTAESVAFMAGPQRGFDAAKALTLIRGERRGSVHALCEHLPRNVYPRGKRKGVAAKVLPLVQDELIYAVPGWSISHAEDESWAEADTGEQLLVRVARHPHAGWGLMISLAFDPVRRVGAPPRVLAALNRHESVRGVSGTAIGSWVCKDGLIEYRVFLPNALLERAGEPYAAAAIAEEAIGSVVVRADGAPLAGACGGAPVTVLHRPAWPHDADAAIWARRDPINDGIDSDLPVLHIWMDMMDRACGTGLESYGRWRATLKPEDLHDRRVRGFIDFWDRQEQRRLAQ